MLVICCATRRPTKLPKYEEKEGGNIDPNNKQALIAVAQLKYIK